MAFSESERERNGQGVGTVGFYTSTVEFCLSGEAGKYAQVRETANNGTQ